VFLGPSSPRIFDPFVERSFSICKLCGHFPAYLAGGSDYTAVGCYSNGLEDAYNSLAACDDPQKKGDGHTRDGVLSWRSLRPGSAPLTIKSIADGTANTILCAELAGRPDLWQRGKKKIARAPEDGGNLAAWPDKKGFQPRANPGGCWSCLDNAWVGVWGSSFDGGAPPKGASQVCFINCTNQTNFGLYSFHPGSCGIELCDGQAAMINENVSALVFCRLITYEGHSLVDAAF
jgi:hypothetical protein